MKMTMIIIIIISVINITTIIINNNMSDILSHVEFDCIVSSVLEKCPPHLHFVLSHTTLWRWDVPFILVSFLTARRRCTISLPINSVIYEPANPQGLRVRYGGGGRGGRE